MTADEPKQKLITIHRHVVSEYVPPAGWRIAAITAFDGGCYILLERVN